VSTFRENVGKCFGERGYALYAALFLFSGGAGWGSPYGADRAAERRGAVAGAFQWRRAGMVAGRGASRMGGAFAGDCGAIDWRTTMRGAWLCNQSLNLNHVAAGWRGMGRTNLFTESVSGAWPLLQSVNNQ